ncbi:MAG: AAA family ATPase [bacterium]|nr:AAA family ATPase [bacterium]
MKEVERQRAANLWEPFARKFPPIAKACHIWANPTIDFRNIGGLAEPKDEIQTYACAITDPEVYKRWGTAPPSGLLLIGPSGSGKTLLAEALAVRSQMPFLKVDVPRLMSLAVHAGSQVGALMTTWGETLQEMPRVTVLFEELDFAHGITAGRPRPDLPMAGIADFLIELIDMTISIEKTLTLASTSRPDGIARDFYAPGRFERVVSVQPIYPDDVIEALHLHAGYVESNAGRTLFENPDWPKVVEQNTDASIGEWVRMLHAVLRSKARREATGEESGLITTQNLLDEVDRTKIVQRGLPVSTGRYL